MEKGGSSSNLHMRYMYKRRPRGTFSHEPNEIPIVGTNLNSNISASATNFFDFLINVLNAPSNPNLAAEGKNVNFNNDDRYLPIANVMKIMHRVLPPHAKITEDTKQAILECVSEFIGCITTEANSKCTREYRKTITPDDVLAAMASLGFDNYAEILSIFMSKYRAQNLDRGLMPHATSIVKPIPTPAYLYRPVAQLASPTAPSVAPPTSVEDYVPVPAPSDYGHNYNPQLIDYFLQNLSKGGGGEGSSTHMHDFDPFQ